MSRRLIAVLALTVTVLLVGAGTLYAYDKQVRTRIADGVTVNGIDVGGLTPAQARAKLQASLLDPLSRPVSVRYKGRRFTLTSEQANVAVDLDGSVDRAMEASTKGSLFTRTWREVRGTEVDARVEAKINYSEEAVRRLVGPGRAQARDRGARRGARSRERRRWSRRRRATGSTSARPPCASPSGPSLST